MCAAKRRIRRFAHTTTAVGGGATVLLAVLLVLLLRPDRPASGSNGSLMLFCAAGMRAPIEAICADFERECGVHVDIQYGGSNTLLNQLQVSHAADLYLAADDAYLAIAREKGLIRERLPIAEMEPVIVVPKGNPDGIIPVR